MATVRQLLTAAARQLNVIDITETLGSAEATVLEEELDSMLDSWSNDPLMIFTRSPYQFATVAGVGEYTLGPSGDWNIPRPMKILSAYANWQPGGTQQVDLPISVLTYQQYAAISVKNTPTSFAFALYDDGNYPLRTISLWPIPTTTTPITLWLQQPLIVFDSIDDTVSFPPGYYDAFKYNLAVRAASLFGKTVAPEVVQYAVATKAAIARLNSVPMIMQGDGGLSSGAQPYVYIVSDFAPWNTR